MKCIIPCAGESSKMNYIPKHLVKIAGKPLISHIVDAWKDYVDNFIFVLKKSSVYMWEYLPGNSAVVFQDEPKGLADAILRAEPYIVGRFMVVLGDCIQKGTWGESKGISLGIGVWKADSVEEFRKSYSVKVKGRLVETVIEKPDTYIYSLENTYCGMGTYFLDTRVFDYIRKTEMVPGGGDFTEVLQAMIDNGEEITPIYFKGNYINVGSPKDLEKAEKILSG